MFLRHGIAARILDSKLKILRKTVVYLILWALASFLNYSTMISDRRDAPGKDPNELVMNK